MPDGCMAFDVRGSAVCWHWLTAANVQLAACRPRACCSSSRCGVGGVSLFSLGGLMSVVLRSVFVLLRLHCGQDDGWC